MDTNCTYVVYVETCAKNAVESYLAVNFRSTFQALSVGVFPLISPTTTFNRSKTLWRIFHSSVGWLEHVWWGKTMPFWPPFWLGMVTSYHLIILKNTSYWTHTTYSHHLTILHTTVMKMLMIGGWLLWWHCFTNIKNEMDGGSLHRHSRLVFPRSCFLGTPIL